jgi:hypothetical protein
VGFAMEVVRDTTTRRGAVAKAKATRLFESVTATSQRFLHLCVPGHLVNDSGRSVLYLPESRVRQLDHERYAAHIEEIAARRASDQPPDQ